MNVVEGDLLQVRKLVVSVRSFRAVSKTLRDYVLRGAPESVKDNEAYAFRLSTHTLFNFTNFILKTTLVGIRRSI